MWFCRYKLRQFAERLPDGTVPITGFNTLQCPSSEHDYARTIARCLFFLSRQKKIEPYSSNLEAVYLRKVDPQHLERMSAVQALLFAGLSEASTNAPFSIEEFMELYYVVAPNGAINRSASFVHHVAVHLLYAFRGVYILQCAGTLDVKMQTEWSETLFNEQHDNVLSAVQSLKRVAAKYCEDAETKIIWLDEGLEVRTDRGNIAVTVADINKMYHNFLSRSEFLLEKMEIDVMCEKELMMAVDFNSRNSGEGLMSMNTKIFEARQSRSKIRLKSEKEQKEFCNLSYELGKLLTMSLYLAGGPSARLTEIANWMVANSNDNSSRNLRFVRNLIVVANTYSKGESTGSKGEGNLVCYSDERLTALVMTYLVIVKRFEHDYSEVFGDEAQKNSRLCFLVHNGNLVTGPTLGLIFRHEFLQSNLDVTIHDMRHVLEAFARKTGCLLESEVRNNPLLQLSNHSSATSNARYGKSQGDLPHVPADRMEECYLYCRHWNAVILNSLPKVSTCGANRSRSASQLDSSSSDQFLTQSPTQKRQHQCEIQQSRSVPESEVPISNEQSMEHFSHTGAEIVNPNALIVVHPPPAVVSFQVSSNVPFLQSEIQQIGSRVQTQGSMPEVQTQLKLSKGSVKRRREVAFNAALQMLGMNELRPLQEKAFTHLKEHVDKHSLIILPTGTGKSKLVALDAITRGVCNILIVPYVAIKDEVLQQGKNSSSLFIASWSEIKHDFESAAISAQVVVAGAEQACPSMVAFIQRIHALGRLGGCFVDEADVLLQEYRALKQFWTLAASCKLVIVHAMTATLRPRDQVPLANMLGIDPEGLMVLRESCIRDDIEVSVRFFPVDHAIMRGLHLFLAGLSATESRIVIFVMTTRAAEELGALLKLSFPDQVSVSHSRHKEALKRIAVVTSCFGHGVNIPGLTHVCIILSTWSVEGFVQVSYAKCMKGRLHHEQWRCKLVITLDAGHGKAPTTRNLYSVYFG